LQIKFVLASQWGAAVNKIFMHYYLTWGVFGLAMAAALLIYYLIVAICCYRQELGAFFKGRSVQPISAAKKEDGYNGMGEVKEDEAEMNLVNSHDLDFAGSEEMPADRDKIKVLLLGSMADFMHELKTLVRITIESEDTKENFICLFRLIASKYPQLTDGAFNGAIVSYVQDSGLPFAISAEDIEPILNDLNNIEDEQYNEET
jgi:hypothetical protein